MHVGFVQVHGRCNFYLHVLRRHGVVASATYRSKRSFLLFVSANGLSYFYFEDILSTMWQTAVK